MIGNIALYRIIRRMCNNQTDNIFSSVCLYDTCAAYSDTCCSQESNNRTHKAKCSLTLDRFFHIFVHKQQQDIYKQSNKNHSQPLDTERCATFQIA